MYLHVYAFTAVDPFNQHPLMRIPPQVVGAADVWHWLSWMMRFPRRPVELWLVEEFNGFAEDGMSWDGWMDGTVDGRNPANQLSLVVYSIIGRVSYMVVQDSFHQQDGFTKV